MKKLWDAKQNLSDLSKAPFLNAEYHVLKAKWVFGEPKNHSHPAAEKFI